MKPAFAAILLCALFIAAALPWIDKPGIQTDEALFAAGIYPPFDPHSVVHIFKHDYPLMEMSYVGALKARLWALIFKLWPPSPASVRSPSVLLSALSVWWMYLLMRRTLGTRPALAAAALLATDPVYILYSRWDHGPVVLQHLCFIGAMLALVRFHQEHRRLWLAAGFLALGLGLWEKTIFAWLIGGLAIAALALFRREIRGAWSFRNAALAAAALVIGAFPLILYNARQNLATIRGNAGWSSQDFSAKARLLRSTLEGGAVFGEFMRDSWEGPVRQPSTAAQKITVDIALAAGMPRRSLMGYLALASVLLLPLVWRSPSRTAALFVMICVTVAWLQMAFTKGAGYAAHHTILLWPLPAMGIAAVLAAATKKAPAVLPLVIAAACVSNLLVLSTYYTNLLRNGGTSSWTDAMYPALSAIHDMPKEAVCTIDWGFFDTVRLFERGRTPMCAAADPVNEEGRRAELWQIAHPGYVFLTHTEGNESFPGVTDRFLQFAASQGFRPVNRRVFADSNGRETVELFQFEAPSSRAKSRDLLFQANSRFLAGAPNDKGDYCCADAPEAASTRVRCSTNGVTSKGIFSRTDSSESGRAFTSSIWLFQGFSFTREPSGSAAICSSLSSSSAGADAAKSARRASASLSATWFPRFAWSNRGSAGPRCASAFKNSPALAVF